MGWVCHVLKELFAEGFEYRFYIYCSIVKQSIASVLYIWKMGADNSTRTMLNQFEGSSVVFGCGCKCILDGTAYQRLVCYPDELVRR